MLLILKLPDDSEFTSLQIEIDAALERDLSKNRKRKLAGTPMPVEEYDESTETDKFIGESTIDILNECLGTNSEDNNGENGSGTLVIKKEKKPVVKEEKEKEFLGLKPDLIALCTVSEKEQNQLSSIKKASEAINDLDLEGLDDDEISGYILSESEAVMKDRLWNKMNAEYLKAAKEREERAAREREEGKPEKKKRRPRKKPIGPSGSAGEAIEKMLQEKKISSKINYDILKSLTAPPEEKEVEQEEVQEVQIESDETIVNNEVLLAPKAESSPRKSFINLSNNRRSKTQPQQQQGLPFVAQNETNEDEEKPVEQVEEGTGKDISHDICKICILA